VTETERGGERGRDGYGAAGRRRSAMWQGKKRRRLDSGGHNRDGVRVVDAGGATGTGIESRMVGRGHWRGIGRGWPDVISSPARDLMQARGASDAKRLQASGRPGVSPSLDFGSKNFVYV
jgi:hypothetical protein